MALFQGVRAYTAELLDRMTEADWAKAGMPTPTGEYSTARWLQSYGPHAQSTPSRFGTTGTLSGGNERALSQPTQNPATGILPAARWPDSDGPSCDGSNGVASLASATLASEERRRPDSRTPPQPVPGYHRHEESPWHAARDSR